MPFSLYSAYSGIVSCDFSAKCSIGVVNGAVLCSQPIHFGFYRHLIRMSIIAHRHSHAGMAHDILQGLWVHALVCHPGTKCVPTGMGCNIGQGLVVALVVLLDKTAEHIVIVDGYIRQSLWIETQEICIALHRDRLFRHPVFQQSLECLTDLTAHWDFSAASLGLGPFNIIPYLCISDQLMIHLDKSIGKIQVCLSAHKTRKYAVRFQTG